VNHDRFERLLLADAPLTSSEEEELHLHLAGCQACSALRARWSRLESSLTAGLMLGPQPGFVGRWAARQAAESDQRERQQAWRLFGGTSVAASSLVALLALVVWQSTGSLPVFFADVLQQGLHAWIWIRLVGEVTHAVATSVPTPVAAGAVLVSLGILAGAGLAAALGSFGLIRFSFQGVRK
jgi:hypothetical protein